MSSGSAVKLRTLAPVFKVSQRHPSTTVRCRDNSMALNACPSSRACAGDVPIGPDAGPRRGVAAGDDGDWRHGPW
jgi:hypothetical protein